MSDTGRKAQVEQEIARLKERLASLMGDVDTPDLDPAVVAIAQSSADNIMLLDCDGNIQFINWTVPDLTPEQVRGTPASRYVGPEFHAAIHACFAEVCATGTPSRYETFYMSPEGEISYWESRVSPVVRNGQVVNLVVNSSNVTAGRAAEAERQRFFTISLDLLCVADARGYFKRVNPAVERILGFTEAELLASPCLDFVHQEDREATAAAFARVHGGQEAVDFENRYRCKDGGYRRLSWRAIADPSSNHICYAVARDVTEQRALEAKLRQSQKMDAIGQLAGGIAHDFNNILMAIAGNVHLALGARSAEKSAGYLREIALAGDRASGLTRQLLSFNRMQPLATKPVELGRLARGLMELLRRLIDERIEIALRVSPGPLVVLGDSGQLEQVLINLCVNARDAMPDGGSLTIEISTAEFERAFADEHAWARSGAFVRVTVTDSGTGMTPDVQQKAFEPFFTTKAAGQGTGLGLATVYSIVQQHAGFIELESELGRGTSVSVYLPVSLEPLSETANRVEDPVAKGSETVLVAEDEESVRRAVVDVLEDAGYRVLVAHNGVEAVELFREHAAEIQLVLLDVVMPGISGPEASSEIRALRPDIAILFASGYADSALSARIKSDGALLLDKPYRPVELLREVRRALDRA